ncbi:MAG: hypothetical protein FWF51_11880 [Chitinivibrionia bacterium]|nr:hypothetical protein [Chitinivibrionia bacterium]
MKKLDLSKLFLAAAIAALAFTGCFDGKKKTDESGAVVTNNEQATEQTTDEQATEQTTSREKSTNYEPRLVGTWIKVKNNKNVVFNSDGTGTGFWMKNCYSAFKYGALDGKIALIYTYEGPYSYTDNITITTVHNYFISKDGRTMIIDGNPDYDSKGSVIGEGVLLKKTEKTD